LYYFCLDDCHDNQLYKHSEPNAVLLLLLLGAFSLGLRRCPWKERSVAVEQLLLGGAAGEQGDHKALLLDAVAGSGFLILAPLLAYLNLPTDLRLIKSRHSDCGYILICFFHACCAADRVTQAWP